MSGANACHPEQSEAEESNFLKSMPLEPSPCPMRKEESTRTVPGDFVSYKESLRTVPGDFGNRSRVKKGVNENRPR